ncbi:NADH-quinone oxidoreductase subunit NuoE [Limibaculum sp. M0105]|uniref:NADH-quinone oxidoreductase subunit NuoE n=1 Tax=Thermohalobaculum xanthum TaxID=2753746 RepID=A0A8J7M4Y7_9RHOB|nr:NADH-quinone oxidoreductase subunit NuoE [Thermohalobaculum xanthum]MBK0397777.1 NADH-quinone oxidoreductase subunit NuoE [Thermohalobaculum xanthum]
MLRRLYHQQPESFAFTPANLEWAKGQIEKYPEGRQASAVIPLLWRGQEQEGWVTRPMIEAIAQMLDMAPIRVLEVASFYFMFQMAPVGSVAHVQVCGTTSCMICGAEDLIGVCKEKIAKAPHALSADGKFSWEEVECLGACANAPMVQIGKDYYEDLTAEKFAWILDELAAGRVPTPGPQNGRFASEPLGGLTSLTALKKTHDANASVALATALGETIKRIDGSEPTATDLMRGTHRAKSPAPVPKKATKKARATGAGESDAELRDAETKGRPETGAVVGSKPRLLKKPRKGGADDLKKISGVGPKLEGLLLELGVFHYDQIAAWTADEIAWVDEHLKFRGRIERDDWVAQAAKLARGEDA